MNEKIDTNKEELDLFIQEITTLKNEEIEQKRKTAHFLYPEFNPQELTEEDRGIWEKVKDGTVTKEEYYDYRDKVEKAENFSRTIFKEFIANKVSPIFAKRQMEELKKQ